MKQSAPSRAPPATVKIRKKARSSYDVDCRFSMTDAPLELIITFVVSVVAVVVLLLCPCMCAGWELRVGWVFKP